MRGRRPIPTAVKRLRGNPGKRKLNSAEPVAPKGVPERPSFITGAAKKLWNELIPQLDEMGVLSKIDGKALAATCQSYKRWLEAEKAISKHGILIESPIVSKKTGEIVGVITKKNPACTISKDEKAAMRSFFALFGMDPSSRSRLKVGEQKPDDPFEALMKSRPGAQAGVQ